MDNISYVALTRQKGLRTELQVIANNLANMSTKGFRAERVVFSEMVQALPTDGGSVAMTGVNARYVDALPGSHQQTGGTFDLAIGGQGFFMIEAQGGIRLSRNGAFSPNENGELITTDGSRVLDAGGAPIFIPPDATQVNISRDGTIAIDGQPQGQIGLVNVEDMDALVRQGANYFSTDQAFQAVIDPIISQGFLEASNVNPVTEITRMIEVQRAYELGQKLMEREDQRVRNVIRTIGQAA